MAKEKDKLFDDGAVSIDEAASFTGLKRSRIYQLMDSGELTYSKVGKRRLIPRNALVALLKKGMVNSNPQPSAKG